MTKSDRLFKQPVATRASLSPPRAWIGFLIAAVGYGILAFRSPGAWGVGLWATLALLIIPILGGLAIGGRGYISWRIAACFRGIGLPMAVYTLIGAFIARHRVQSAPGSGMEAILPITILYCLAATVAALAANLLRDLAAKRQPSQ